MSLIRAPVIGLRSGSVTAFASELLALKRAVVGACRKSPRSAYLLLRRREFNTAVDEVHGFLGAPTLLAGLRDLLNSGWVGRDDLLSTVGGFLVGADGAIVFFDGGEGFRLQLRTSN